MKTKTVPPKEYEQGKRLWEVLMARFLEKYCQIAKAQAAAMVERLEPQDKLRIAAEMYMNPQCLDPLIRSIRSTKKLTSKDKVMLEGWKSGAVVLLAPAGWCQDGIVLKDPDGVLFVIRMPNDHISEYILSMPGSFWYNMLPYPGYNTFHVNWGFANADNFQPLEVLESALDLSEARQNGMVVETPDQLKQYAENHRRNFVQTMASDADPVLREMMQTAKVFPDLTGKAKDTKTTSAIPAKRERSDSPMLPFEIAVPAGNLWKQMCCQFMDTFCRAKYKNILRNYDRLGPFNKALAAITLYQYPALFNPLIDSLLDHGRISKKESEIIRTWKDGMVLKLCILGQDQNCIVGQDEDGVFYAFQVLSKNAADMLSGLLPSCIFVHLVPVLDTNTILFTTCCGQQSKKEAAGVNVKALMQDYKNARSRGEVIETPEQLKTRADQKREEFFRRLQGDLAGEYLTLEMNASYHPVPDIIQYRLEEENHPNLAA